MRFDERLWTSHCSNSLRLLLQRESILAAILIACLLLSPVLAHAAKGFPLVIDPGHGGTDGGKPSPIEGFYEKHVNLEVAFAMWDSLVIGGFDFEEDFYLTRTGDSALTRPQRAAYANALNAGSFISIHHNGDTSPTPNYTWVLYCNDPLTDTGASRSDTTSTLAAKIGLRIKDKFGLELNSCTLNESPCVNCLDVLRLTTMSSALTEASFISNPAEAELFFSTDRAEVEAGAIYHGWHSWTMDAGFAIVSTPHSGGNDGAVWVDGTERESPYLAAWELLEGHELVAPSSQVFPDSIEREFFRWVSIPVWYFPRDTSKYLAVTYENTYNVMVGWEYTYHLYKAFYRGGPYPLSIYPPSDTVYVGDTLDVPYTFGVGADSTTVLTVRLDRQDGESGYPEVIFEPDYFDEVE